MKEASHGAITDINVTPLVDVCLVLVIIFMVLAPFVMQAGIEIASTRGKAAQGRAALKENVYVALDEKGDLRVNGARVPWEKLGETLSAALVKSRDQVVSLDASPKASVGQVVEVLDASRQSGAKKLAIVNSAELPPLVPPPAAGLPASIAPIGRTVPSRGSAASKGRALR